MAELRTVRKVQCGGCRKYFAGDSSFYDHRTGSYGEAIHDKEGNVTDYTPHSRRCLSTEEMQAAGFASERLLVNMRLDNKPIKEEHDIWYVIADREKARKAFGRQTDDEDEEDNDD